MSSVRSGVCTPTHVNFEVWTLAARERELAVYANESYVAGATGYLGYSGIYTTTNFVKDGVNTSLYPSTFYADFWKDYVKNDALIDALSYAKFQNNSAYYPIKKGGCADKSFGCENQCSRSHACTLRKDKGGECMVVMMMYDSYDPGYLQAAISNLDIPAYFCFLGYGGLEAYALAAQQQEWPVLFYHYMPDLFLLRHASLFQRVFLPYPSPEQVVQDTGTFGENGYGELSTNPVRVDIPPTKINKYVSLRLQESQPIGPFLSKFALSDLIINDLIRLYFDTSTDTNEPDPEFRAACNWLKTHYEIWRHWLDRLPLCALSTHATYSVLGCTNGSDTRTIAFEWKAPHPENASQPFECDGGVSKLPTPIVTSRTCAWILEDDRRWMPWIDVKPTCDASFYTYNISDCDRHAKRIVTFFWLIADPVNPALSAECIDGIVLPASVTIDCEYMPSSSPVFFVVLIIAHVIAIILLAGMVFVFRNRGVPIIKRSQYELLELMLAGGVVVCIASVVYAGKPSFLLCGLRPVTISTGFTTIFSALFVKSLRVYRVFMKSAMKRVKVSLFMMIKFILVFFSVDVVIFVAWYAMDFPTPTTTIEQAREFHGEIGIVRCESSSFIFSALLIFWKAILLFMGIYVSFLVRNVSSDFQESMWIFGSALVVLFGSLVILPLAYLVEMAAAAFYVFLAFTLLLCTLLVMVFMFVPKLFRLHSVMSKRSSHTTASERYASGKQTGVTNGESSDVGESTTTTRLSMKKSNTPSSTTAIVKPSS
uniref:G-protein coupled receptors family 3 profile domain-containing protein n=1 Tax=Globisporangium ultimum (strain ATCC 200006 / CBS 805.95 / DAOM BR144) TaxID=431595 RepID=K3X030_GLOUD